MKPHTALQRSVQVRLVNHARKIGVDPNLILTRYAAERLLYRLSRSRYGERFVLKGAMLLLVWLGEMVRPTRDVDLLGFGDLSDAAIEATFAEVVTLEVETDGVTFDAASIAVAPIRAEDAYGGKRVTLMGHLGSARLKVQIDIGIGDAVYPEPRWLDYPSLLDFPRPHLRAYRPETSIAEKLHAMVTLGSKNSRMRDFFDIRALAEHESFDGSELRQSIRTTFERRSVAISSTPLALTPAFAEVEGKCDQWNAFLRKNGLARTDFRDVIRDVSAFLVPAISGLASGRAFDRHWPPGGPWQ
jgi:predicted nucleotidyltransferase component of viral defense system